MRIRPLQLSKCSAMFLAAQVHFLSRVHAKAKTRSSNHEMCFLSRVVLFLSHSQGAR